MASKSNKKINIEVKLLQNLVTETKKMSAALNDFGNKLTKVKTASTAAAKQSKENANSFKSLAGSIIGFSGSVQSSIFKVTGMTFAFKLLGSTLKTVLSPWTSMIQSNIKFETALIGVEKTVTTTAGGMRQLKTELIELTTQIPLNITQIGTIAQLAGQLGVQTRNIAKFTKTIGLLSISTNLSIEEAATGIARLSNIMGESLDHVEDIANVIVHLGNNFATTEREIVQFSLRIGSAAKQAGLTTANTLALATALSSVGLRSESAGSGISRTIIRIQEAVLGGGQKLEDFAEISGLSVEKFSELFKTDGVQAITAFLDGLGRLAASGRGTQAVLEELGLSELRLANVLRSLANAQDLTARAVAAANEEMVDGNALHNESTKFIKSTANQVKDLNNEYDVLKKRMGDNLTPAFKSLVMWLGQVIGKMSAARHEVAQLYALQAQAATKSETKNLAEKLIPDLGERVAKLRTQLDILKRVDSASFAEGDFGPRNYFDEASGARPLARFEMSALRKSFNALGGFEGKPIEMPVELDLIGREEFFRQIEGALAEAKELLRRQENQHKPPHELDPVSAVDAGHDPDDTLLGGMNVERLKQMKIEKRLQAKKEFAASKAARDAAAKALREANRAEDAELTRKTQVRIFLLDQEKSELDQFQSFLENLAKRKRDLDVVQGLSGDALKEARIRQRTAETIQKINEGFDNEGFVGDRGKAIAQALDIQTMELEALLKKTQSSLDEFAVQTSKMMMESFETFFFDVISGEFDNLGDLAKSLGQQILTQLFTTLVAAPLTRTIQDKLGVDGTNNKQKGIGAVLGELGGLFSSGSSDADAGGQSGDSAKNVQSAQMALVEKQKEGEQFSRATTKAEYATLTKFAGVLGTTAFALASAFGGSGGGVSGIFGMIAKVTGLAASVVGNFGGSFGGGGAPHESASMARTMGNLKDFESFGSGFVETGIPELGTGGFIRGGAMDSIKASAVNAGVSAFTSGGKAFNGPMFGVFGERGNEIVAKMLPPGSHALGGPGATGGGSGGGNTPIELKVAVVDNRAQALNADQIIELTAGDALVGGKLGEAVLQIQVRR